MRVRIEKALATAAVFALASAATVGGGGSAAAAAPGLRAYGITADGKQLLTFTTDMPRAPRPGLLEAQRAVTAVVAAAQRPDGYLNSMVRERYRDLPWSHEHYCAGHLMQAAVAQSRATGDKALLEVAVRFADHLVATFGPRRTEDVDGHPVVEMGLVELYRETGRRDYLDLARWFVGARGHGLVEKHGHEPTYFADRVPVREQATVEGHAVRAVYLAAGAAELGLPRPSAPRRPTSASTPSAAASPWNAARWCTPSSIPPPTTCRSRRSPAPSSARTGSAA